MKLYYQVLWGTLLFLNVANTSTASTANNTSTAFKITATLTTNRMVPHPPSYSVGIPISSFATLTTPHGPDYSVVPSTTTTTNGVGNILSTPYSIIASMIQTTTKLKMSVGRQPRTVTSMTGVRLNSSLGSTDSTGPPGSNSTAVVAPLLSITISSSWLNLTTTSNHRPSTSDIDVRPTYSFTASSSSSINTESNDSESDSSGDELSTAEIAGIASGVTAALLLLLVILICVCVKRPDQRTSLVYPNNTADNVELCEPSKQESPPKQEQTNKIEEAP